ncbi:MAG: hypothetical protein H5U15_04055 [Roseovarius sp.]|nr:hypothetical protein [Roseovarius sp.]
MAALLSTLGGCANYANNWDGATARVGNASEANTAIHAIPPDPRNLNNTKVHGGR